MTVLSNTKGQIFMPSSRQYNCLTVVRLEGYSSVLVPAEVEESGAARPGLRRLDPTPSLNREELVLNKSIVS